MSVKISWTAMGSTPDTLTVFWADTAFTYANLPTNSVDIPPDSTSYTDSTIPAYTARFYMMRATKAGKDDLYSQCMSYGNYPKTGLGRNKVLRGNWEAGLMDVLTPAQVFTIAGLKTALGLATSWGGTVTESNLTAWFKFVRRGKILLIPSTPFSNNSVLRWSDIYNNGLMYGVDGPGDAPYDLVTGGFAPAISAPVNQKKVVTLGGENYLVRTPRLSTLPTNQTMPANKDSFPGGEWWELMCRMTGTNIAADDEPKLPPEKWYDYKSVVPFGCGATPHLLASSVACCLNNTNWSAYLGRDGKGTAAAAWVHWIPVLELIP
jgi:hypothetical protein